MLLVVFVSAGRAAGVLNVWRLIGPGRSRRGQVTGHPQRGGWDEDVAVAAGHDDRRSWGSSRLHTVGSVVGASVNFTQANLMMVHRRRADRWRCCITAPGRGRSCPAGCRPLAELCYDFVYGMCTDQIGAEGRRFFPFVFTLFFFILFGNLLGRAGPTASPSPATSPSPGAGRVMVIVLVTVVALRLHGLAASSATSCRPARRAAAPIIVPIEIISYLSRPVSLSVRLFANMVAGHVMLEVFASFMVMLAAAGAIGFWARCGAASRSNVAMIGFEFLVAVLQAYVFAILTFIYLHDAVHLH